MKIKKMLALFCSAVMLISVFASCTQADESTATDTDAPATEDTTPSGDGEAADMAADPFYKYPETLNIEIPRLLDPNATYPEGDDITNNQYTRLIEERLNITFTSAWEAAPGNDTTQKVNLAIATNDLPDMMVVNETQFRALIAGDQIMPLQDSYNAYVSDAQRTMLDSSEGRALDAVTVDGNMMAIPALNVPDNAYGLVWVRKDWLDALGLEGPKTMDDVISIAEQFMSEDPGNVGDNIVGIAAPANGQNLYGHFLSPAPGNGTFDPFFTAMDSYPGWWMEQDGEVVYGSILPETKDALAVLADMYADGLIDPQLGVREDSTEAPIAGHTGIFCAPWWSGYGFIKPSLANDPTANWQSYVLMNDEGVYNSKITPVAESYLVVRKGYENPEAATILTNLQIVAESEVDVGALTAQVTPLRLPQAAYDEGFFSVEALRGILAGDVDPSEYAKEEYLPYKLLAGDAEAVLPTIIDPTAPLDIENWDREAAPEDLPRLMSLLLGSATIVDHDIEIVPSLTYSPTETTDTKWTALKKMEDELFFKIIVGQESIDAFDQFVTDWKAQGGDEITAEVAALQ